MKNSDGTTLRVWVAETFDCDDLFQVLKVLKGNVNTFFPYQNNTGYFVEPPSGSFCQFGKTKCVAGKVIL